MVEEYVRTSYLPSNRRHKKLSDDDFAKARELAVWRRNLNHHWHQVRIESVHKHEVDVLHVGDTIQVTARVALGTLTPADVEVQLYHGLVDSLGDIPDAQAVALVALHQEANANGQPVWNYQGRIPCQSSGQYGYAVRVLPKHSSLPHFFEPCLVTWG
jgi:starch phosphorylase